LSIILYATDYNKRSEDVLNKTFLIVLCLILIAGCSTPDSGRLTGARNADSNNFDRYSSEESKSIDNDFGDDSGQREEIRATLHEAETYYTNGVIFYQRNLLDSSQIAFEEVLLVLSELEFDPDIFKSEARWMEILLKEIESDYRLTLMTSGVLYSEGSTAAFRDLFSDIKNFKRLKESGEFHHYVRDSIVYDVPIYLNEKVENSLAYLQTVAHNTFEKYLSHSGRYIPLMEKILAEEGVPHDLVYLPLIESGFNAHAYSYARAVGFWQFIYSTGKRYGMKRNWWYDERRDFEKSTRAAARYLKNLYDEFGSWELALAGYNGGEGRVRKEIKRHKTKDFWKLRLKKQTRNYVPLFMAATIIAKQPDKYGFFPSYEEPIEWETVKVSKCMTFNNISAKTGIAVANLELLNPELIRGATPPNYKNYKLRIPVGKSGNLLAAYDKIPSEKNTNWVKHKIRRGETVSTIARKYGVSMSSIVSANDLRRPYRIIAGKSLMIPTAKGKSWSSSRKGIVPDGSGTYAVKRGDTLWEIARAHGVSVRSLKNVNRLSSNRIYVGRKLKIPGGTGNDDIGGNVHTVKPGDSLSRIAKRYGVSIAALKKHNRLKTNTIYPNMKLKIPHKGSSNALSMKNKQPTIYRVKKGDTLTKIARIFGVTIQELVAWNDISNPSKIPRGKKLKIYNW